MSEWDDKVVVEKEFPQSEFDWYEVSSPDEGRAVIANLAFHAKEEMTLGEARWFGPEEGVILVKKSKPKQFEIEWQWTPSPYPVFVKILALLFIITMIIFVIRFR